MSEASRMNTENLFKTGCSLVGAVHVPALPGSADYAGDINKIIETTVMDSLAYVKGGCDALIIENMHDVPYLNGAVEPETVAAMTACIIAAKKEVKVPLGVQLLAAANLHSLAVALACGLDFIRVEGFVFAHVGDEGLHQSSAAALIRKRAALKANHIKIFADIKKKHSSHAITADLSLGECAHAAEFFKADGVIVTGGRTGEAPDREYLEEAKKEVKIPVLIGSGVTAENVGQYKDLANALIVGSSLKKDGNWQNPVDINRVQKLKQAIIGVILVLLCMAPQAMAKSKNNGSPFTRAIDNYKANNLDQARKDCLAVLKECPRLTAAHYLMGNILLKQNQTDRAAAEYEYCIKVNDDKSITDLCKQALDGIRAQSAIAPAPSVKESPKTGTTGNNTFSPDNSAVSEDEKRLLKEAEDRIATKKAVLDRKLAQLKEDEEKDNYANRPVRRRFGGRYQDQEAVSNIKTHYENERKTLQEQFDRDAAEIQRHYDSRIAGMKK